MKKLLPILLAGALLQACATGSSELPPSLTAPKTWFGLQSSTMGRVVPSDSQTIHHLWWQVFNDPALNDVMQRALQNNLDLQIAAARVAEAMADRQSARATLMPQVDVTAGASRGEEASSTARASRTTQWGVEASWELDLFGRNNKQTDAASALLQSAVARQHGVQVSLLAEVARHYFALRNLDTQVVLTEKNLSTQRQTLAIIQARVEAGGASDFDLQRSAAQVSTTEALLPPLRQAKDAAAHRLNVLMGEMPGHLVLMPAQSCVSPVWAHTPILLAAPAVVLTQRPDVQAAERDLAAAIATTDAERRAWLPGVNLLAMFGMVDNTSFSATPWRMGASLVQPLLNFGRIDARVEGASARQKQAALAYKKVVLMAVEDMENALSAYLHETQRTQALYNSMVQNRQALALAQERFHLGAIDLLDQLSAERNTLQAEADFAASQALLNQRMAAIYAAAGGGWDVPE